MDENIDFTTSYKFVDTNAFWKPSPGAGAAAREVMNALCIMRAPVRALHDIKKIPERIEK